MILLTHVVMTYHVEPGRFVGQSLSRNCCTRMLSVLHQLRMIGYCSSRRAGRCAVADAEIHSRCLRWATGTGPESSIDLARGHCIERYWTDWQCCGAAGWDGPYNSIGRICGGRGLVPSPGPTWLDRWLVRLGPTDAEAAVRPLLVLPLQSLCYLECSADPWMGVNPGTGLTLLDPSAIRRLDQGQRMRPCLRGEMSLLLHHSHQHHALNISRLDQLNNAKKNKGCESRHHMTINVLQCL